MNPRASQPDRAPAAPSPRPALARAKQPARPGPRDRRGSAYVLVLAAVGAVTAIVLLGSEQAQLQRRTTQTASNAQAARALALSALEIGAQRIASGTAWRSALPGDGQWLTDRRLGTGLVSLQATDPVDNDLTKGNEDAVTLKASATIGSVYQAFSARFNPVLAPLPALSNAITVGGTVNVSGGSITSSVPLTSNASVTSKSATVALPVEAVGSITGTTYTSTTTTPVAARTMPVAADIIAAYTPLATTISYSATTGTLERCLLSPASNPFGAVNPKGIYLINCAGQKITVQNVRVVGTLILVNPRSDSQIAGSVCFEQGPDALPVLIVDGSCTFAATAVDLSEQSVGVNLNPASTPFATLSNTTQLDAYPSELRGLVYVSGNLTLQGELTLRGSLIVGGTLATSGTVAITPDTTLTQSPPLGFRTVSGMAIAPGTIARVAR